MIAIRDVMCPAEAMQNRMQDVKSMHVLCLAESAMPGLRVGYYY